MAKSVGVYTVVIAVCLVALTLVLKLWQADLSIPFSYASDGLLNSLLIKGVIDNGWYFHNSFVGAPYGLSMLDFPMADNLHFILIKLFSLFTDSYGTVMNLFFLATFPLTVASALFVFRRLSLPTPLAAAGSLQFAFLPYHFFRGELHLLLSGIYVIPLASLAIIRVCSETPPLIKLDGAGEAAYDLRSRRTLGYALIALLTASAGIYYAFFACFLLAVAGIYAAICRRSLMRLAAAGILIGFILFGLIVNLSPNIVHDLRYGRNAEVAARTPVEAELLGTTVTQLVLPATGHRVGFLNDLKQEFIQGAALIKERQAYVNENDWSSLGVIGSLGFLFLLAWLIFSRGRSKDGGSHGGSLLSPTLDSLGVLNITALLLATIGGFGLLFSLLLSAQIRAYNRISIFIGFFSILAVLLLLDRWRRGRMNTGNRPLVFFAITLTIAVISILDQTNDDMIPDYDGIGRAYAGDQAFVQRIETTLPAQSLVFQLPYVPFPENPMVNTMPDYNHLRAYLHSRTLHWSYGTMKGRTGDLWQRSVSAEPAARFLKDIAAAGFSGIWVNRAGYADGAASIEQQLERELGAAPVANDDNTLLFFDMQGYLSRQGAGT